MKPFQVLLYYKYTTVQNPEKFTVEHLTLCKELGLRGRILVAEEGINGTVSGTKEATEKYIAVMQSDPLFADMPFKIDEADEHAFKKMFVRLRNEIVTFRLEDDINPNEQTGHFLSPQQFLKAMQEDDVIIIDARNDYEYEIGHFRHAIRPKVDSFREFPEFVEQELMQYKNKKVLTYCTGGIRCEKFSGYLLEKGFTDVHQLHGGIIAYSQDEQVQGQLFDGKCYVFDERISVPINKSGNKIVGKCYYCAKPEDRYVNCANPECNLQHVCCEECEGIFKRSCCSECRDHPRNRYVYEHRAEPHFEQS